MTVADILVVFFVLVNVASFLVQADSIPTDPCTSSEELPRAKYRGGQCRYVFEKEICDNSLNYGWYRAVGLNNTILEMQTTPAGFGTCGTKNPYWMNGTHPKIEDDEVSRTLCMSNLFSNCSLTMKITVKHCQGFYVYKLQSTPGCTKGYCFGRNDTCPPFDPCDVYEHSSIHYDKGRSSNCSRQSGKCDNVNNTKWYKFESSSSYLNLSSTCPTGSDSCGSSMSAWINSTIQFSNGTEEHTVCMKNGTECCSSTYTIHSKMCKRFRVYHFEGMPTDTCHRYCTEDNAGSCPTTTTTLTTTTTTTTTHSFGNNSSHEKNVCAINKQSYFILRISGLVLMIFSALIFE